LVSFPAKADDSADANVDVDVDVVDNDKVDNDVLGAGSAAAALVGMGLPVAYASFLQVDFIAFLFLCFLCVDDALIRTVVGF